MNINRNYLELKGSYLFSTVARKVREYKEANPNADVISLGIGDVTLPLVPAIVEAMHGAVDDMSKKETFKGYGPESGYPFLRDAIRDYYKNFGVELLSDEIFISDGAKSDLGNILDIFGKNKVAISDPAYPVYIDTNVMNGNEYVFLQANKENGFLPLPYEGLDADIIYLCSPNNPTGSVYNHEQLKQWVEYANKNDAIILFDAAYEAFIGTTDYPHSIYEIEGAKTCAIEFCSFSKTAGFTGTRCGYTVVPFDLKREGVQLHGFWTRRQTTKFNGTAYIIQKGAAAIFSEEGYKQTRENIAYYMENAKIIADALDEMGIWYTGGKYSPYVWLKCPNNMSSWEFFDELLQKANVVGTPGEGFGENGKGYFRLTAFGDRERTKEAVRRIKEIFGNK